MIRFKRLSDLDLKGRRVFIRADLNVPQDDAGAITDDTRIRASVPAIEHCLAAGAAVMVTSHLGRPTEGQFKPEDSLAPIAQRLSERLGRPATILCLGNGPSSEDPRLAGIAHDALFRVNWRWLERGLLTQPDMVFVGDLRTTSKVRDCVFGFRTVAWESEVLLRHLLQNI